MKTLLILLLLSLCAGPLYTGVAQHVRGVHRDSPCSQPVAQQSSLVRKAEKNRYLVGRVEFIGNENTSDWVLRRRVLLQEGDVFTRAILVKSLAQLGKLRIVYPVKLSDVVVHLNDDEKTIDVEICFKERGRRIRTRLSSDRYLQRRD